MSSIGTTHINMNKRNNIPKHWQLKKLGEVCQIIMGQSPPSITYNSNGIGLPFFQGKAEFTELYPIVEKWCNAPNKIAEPNDILLSVRAPVGTTNIANVKCCIGRGLAAIRYDNYKYIFFFLRSIEQHLDKKGTGTTFRAISGETIRTTEIPIPPLPEQQTIVAKIEELFSDLENGKQQLLLAQQQLKIYRQSLLKWAFEGKLTNKHLKEGELPKSWKIDELKNVVEKISDGPFGSNLKSIDYVDKGIRVIRLENIGVMEFRDEYKTYVTPEKYETIKRHTVGKGDIIFSSFISDSIRSVILPDFIEKAINKADCFLVRADESKINRKYLAYYFFTKALQSQLVNQIHGATRPRINTTQLKASLIPIAPIEEQQLIVSELESKLTVCDKIEETISQSLLQAESLKQSILKKAFEGKLV
jgi:type I restriction enzyme, S subunit